MLIFFRRIPGRSESQVKNVYYSAVRRAQRETERLGQEVPPSFIVEQTAEREAKAGHCSLPEALETDTPTLRSNQVHTAPPGGTPESDGSPHGGMLPTPYTSPAAGPAVPPAHLPPAAMGSHNQADQANFSQHSFSQDGSGVLLPASTGTWAPSPQARVLSQQASAGPAGSTMPHYSPVMVAASSGLQRASVPPFTLPGQQTHPHQQSQLAQGWMGGIASRQQVAQAGSSAVLPNVVPSGSSPAGPVHLFRRKHYVAPSPLTGASGAPSMLSIPSTSLGRSASDAGMNSDQEGNLTPSVHVERFLQADGDGDVDLEQANERIDSWLKPTSGAASPHLLQGRHGAHGTGSQSAFAAGQLPSMNPAHTGYSGQMFVAGSTSPSLILSGGTYAGMLPQAPPSAFFATMSPNAQSSRVG